MADAMTKPSAVRVVGRRGPVVATLSDAAIPLTTWPKTLVVHTEPVAKGRPRFGNGRAYTPTETRHAEWCIRRAWIDVFGETPTAGPLRLDIAVWRSVPKSMPKSRRQSAQPTTRPDIDNYAKTVLDGLDGVAYSDDAQIVDLRVRKCYAEFSGYWEIALSELVGEDESHGR